MQPVIDDIQLQDSSLAPDIRSQLLQRSNLFADSAVFVSKLEVTQIQSQINAIEAISTQPQYIQHIRNRDSTPEYPQCHTRGLLMGYDFHLTPDGPRLIEVNTNAGGAFIMHHLLSAITSKVTPCDAETLDAAPDIEQKLLQMLLNEWKLGGRRYAPGRIAIIDQNSESQYLFPDMRLAQCLLEKSGIATVIAAPSDLQIEDGRLLCNEQPVDFIYNRTTDFTLSETENSVLKQALLDDLAVISPNPFHHSIYADKRNPTIWKNAELLNNWGISQNHINALTHLPFTETVHTSDADHLWSRRKHLFFKPTNGFGSRAVYRGNKVTRKVWENISKGDYVAQSMVPPPTRRIEVEGQHTQMKFDVRVYSYRGQWLLGAARVYQGQTTNFRTPGGGLAPLIYI